MYTLYFLIALNATQDQKITWTRDRTMADDVAAGTTPVCIALARTCCNSSKNTLEIKRCWLLPADRFVNSLLMQAISCLSPLMHPVFLKPEL